MFIIVVSIVSLIYDVFIIVMLKVCVDKLINR